MDIGGTDGAKRGTEVSWSHTNKFHESIFQFTDLVIEDFVVGDEGDVGVTPCVGGDLVASGEQSVESGVVVVDTVPVVSV